MTFKEIEKLKPGALLQNGSFICLLVKWVDRIDTNCGSLGLAEVFWPPTRILDNKNLDRFPMDPDEARFGYVSFSWPQDWTLICD
jgi:hypothetical protein